MGPAHDARHLGAEQHLPRSHVPHERPHHGHQGHPVLPERPAGRRPLRRMRQEALPAHHRVLHLPAHPAHDHQHVLVLRHDQYFRRVRRHLQRGVRVRGRRHRREGALPGLRAGEWHVRRQHGDFAGPGGLSDGEVSKSAPFPLNRVK